MVEIDSTLRGCTKGVMHIGMKAKAAISQEPGPDLYPAVGGPPGEVIRWLWLTAGTRTLVAEVLGSIH